MVQALRSLVDAVCVPIPPTADEFADVQKRQGFRELRVGGAQGIRIQVEQRNRGIGDRPFGLVREVVRADTDIEMACRDIAIVKRAQNGGRAAPRASYWTAQAPPNHRHTARTVNRSPVRPQSLPF
jgi:hypothetical protein